MAGERCPAPGAVWDYLKALIEELLIPDLFQSPPFGLDIFILVSYIGILHIGPEADLFGEILPHSLILPNGLLTLLNKRLQTVFFNLVLPLYPKLLFDLQLHRQAMGVPAGLSRDIVTFHSPVARYHVLYHASQDMADMGFSIGSRRPVIKGIGRGPRFLPLFH